MRGRVEARHVEVDLLLGAAVQTPALAAPAGAGILPGVAEVGAGDGHAARHHQPLPAPVPRVRRLVRAELPRLPAALHGRPLGGGRAEHGALGLEGPVHGGRLEGGRAITIVVGLHFGVLLLLLVLVRRGAAHGELLVVLVVAAVAGAGVGQLHPLQVAGLGWPAWPAQA